MPTEMNDYEAKFSAAMTELVGAGIQKSPQATGALYLARALGLKPRPPLYSSAIRNSINLGTIFTVIWGMGMYVFVWSTSNIPVSVALGSAIVAGAIFGVMMAIYLGFTHRRKKLSAWEDL